MRLRIYNKNVKWTRDSIDKPYFYSKENQNIRQNIDNYFNALTFTDYPKFKINGSDMDIKTITVDNFDDIRRNYCSVLLNNKEYYYFIEKVDILNEKGLFRLSLQLDTWTTFFEEMVSKFGNSVVAIRKHGKRFKRNTSNQVIYNYDRTSNVWNIDGQFTNLAKHNARKQNCDTIVYLNKEGNIVLDKPLGSFYTKGTWGAAEFKATSSPTGWNSLQSFYRSAHSIPDTYANIIFENENGIEFPNNDPRGFEVNWASKVISSTKTVWFHEYRICDTVVTCNHEIASDTQPPDTYANSDKFAVYSGAKSNDNLKEIKIFYCNSIDEQDPNLYFKKNEDINFPIYNNELTLPQKSWYIGNLIKQPFKELANRYYVRPYQVNFKGETNEIVKKYPILSTNNVIDMFCSTDSIVSDGINYTNKIDPLINFEEIEGDITVSSDILWNSINNMLYPLAYGIFKDMIVGECKGKKIGVYVTCFINLEVFKNPSILLTLSTTPTHSGSIIERQCNFYQIYASPEKGISYWSLPPDKMVYNIVPRTSVYSEGYRDIYPYETIDITNDDYDYKREPQIWMSHCHENIFNYYNYKSNKKFELNPGWDDIKIFKYITLTQMYVGVELPTDGLTTIASNNTTVLDIEVPSNSDSYSSYLALNKNSLQTSLYGIDKNIDFTKQAGNLSIKQAQVSATMSGISSVTNAIGGVISGALGGVFSGGAGMIAGGIGGAISGATNMANTIAQGAMGVEKAQLNAEKNNFGAEQQMRSAVASQLDIANAPDTINGVNFDFFGRGFYESKTGSDCYRLWTLPSISTLQEYADYMNRYGYLSGNQIHDFSKDRILMRKRFNYWQVQDLSIGLTDREGIPLFALKYFRELFNNGVRMWSDVEGMYDYSKENWEYDI